MMGQVIDGYPTADVVFRLPGQPDLRISCVIDTGFAGYLTLPPAAVAALQLPFFYRLPANLANDANIMVDVFTATILWHDAPRDVEILAMGKRPLIGRALLSGDFLGIEFRPDGVIRIEPLP